MTGPQPMTEREEGPYRRLAQSLLRVIKDIKPNREPRDGRDVL